MCKGLLLKKFQKLPRSAASPQFEYLERTMEVCLDHRFHFFLNRKWRQVNEKDETENVGIWISSFIFRRANAPLQEALSLRRVAPSLRQAKKKS